MSLKEGHPLDLLGAPSIFGQPYHGLATAETRDGVFGWWLALPNGQYKLLDTVTPPSQNAIVPGTNPGLGQFRVGPKRIEIPGVPPVVRNEMQAAEDVEAGREWRTVAMYGDVASLGVSIGNLWADSTGARWRVLVSSAQVDQDFAGTISIEVSVRRFGAFGRPDTNETKTKVYTMTALGQTGPADGWQMAGHVIRMTQTGETSRDGSRHMIAFDVDHELRERDVAFIRAASWHSDAATPINRFASCPPALCGMIEIALTGSPDLPGGWDFSVNVLKTRDAAMGAYSNTSTRTGTILGERLVGFTLQSTIISDTPEGQTIYSEPVGPNGLDPDASPWSLSIRDDHQRYLTTVTGALVGMYYDPVTDLPVDVTVDFERERTFDASYEGGFTGSRTSFLQYSTGQTIELENTLKADVTNVRADMVRTLRTLKRAGVVVDSFETRVSQSRTYYRIKEYAQGSTLDVNERHYENFAKAGDLEVSTTGINDYTITGTGNPGASGFWLDYEEYNLSSAEVSLMRVFGPIWGGPRFGEDGPTYPPVAPSWQTTWITLIARQSRTSWRLFAGTQHTSSMPQSIFHAGQLIYPGGLMPGYAAAPITALPAINVAYNPVTGECVQRDRPVCWV